MLLRARLHFICWRVPKTLRTSELLEVTHCHALLEGPEQPAFVKTNA